MSRVSVVHPLPPIIDSNSKVLILGSFPSVVSRQKSFYYANPNNRFWKVLSNLFNEEIDDYEDFCHNHHIALWDVIQSCTIEGSNDASIKDIQVNPIQALCENSNIEYIFTTGKKASDLYKKYIDCSITHIPLPSTSSANAAMRLDDLIREYRVIKEKIDEEN